MEDLQKFTSEKKVYYTITGKTDGFGSQYQAIMSGIAYCYYNNYEYIHTPIIKMEHLLLVLVLVAVRVYLFVHQQKIFLLKVRTLTLQEFEELQSIMALKQMPLSAMKEVPILKLPSMH